MLNTTRSLDVILNKTEKLPLSKQDIHKTICKKASFWTTFWLLMATSFLVGTLLAVVLFITVQPDSFVGWIFVGVFGICAAIFTCIYCRKRKDKKKMYALLPEDIVVDIITCINKKRTGSPNDNEVTFTISTEKGDFFLSYTAYNTILIGDKLAYVNVSGTDTAYPLKCWEIQGVNEQPSYENQ